MDRRHHAQIAELLFAQNRLEVAAAGIIGSRQIRTGRGQTACNQCIAEESDGAGAGKHIRIHQSAVIVCGLNAAVINAGNLIVIFRVNFIHAGEAILHQHGRGDFLLAQVLVVGINAHAHEIQFAVFLCGATQNVDGAVQTFGQQNLGFASLYIKLIQNAACVGTVRLTDIHIAVIHCIDAGFDHIRVKVTKAMGQNSICAKAAIHGANINPVAVGFGRIAVGLSAVANVFAACAWGIGTHFAATEIIDYAIVGFQAKVSVRDFFPLHITTPVTSRNALVQFFFGISFLCKSRKRGCAEHGRAQQHGTEPFYKKSFLHLFSPF